MQVQHQYDGVSGGVIVPGAPCVVTEEWRREVAAGVEISRNEAFEVELIENWHLESKDQGLIADLRTGAVRPMITSTHILFPRRESGALMPAQEKDRFRAVALAEHQMRRHFPVHGIIGVTPPEWRGSNVRSSDLVRRAEWERTLLKPENLADFVNIYRPIILLGWERLDFAPILARLEKQLERSRDKGHGAKVSRFERVVERATADLLCVRTIYTAILDEDMAKADAAWRLLSEVIPAEWVKREYKPGAAFDDLQALAMDPLRAAADDEVEALVSSVPRQPPKKAPAKRAPTTAPVSS